MKKTIFSAMMIAVLLVGFQACKQKDKAVAPETEYIDDGHNSQNSLNWDGTYVGEIPCADCPGINVSIVLNPDETYSVTYVYIDRKGEPSVTTGKFTWDEAGSVIKLDSQDLPPYYKVIENGLIQLDMEGNLITGELADKYVLKQNIEPAE
ncbi:MAG: copper resistance protein NlpE [Dysgonamonadaceae bacterium]|jgi:uncharacterized lipoprotein NlpE involved in copper resistance|nr:copper resistance protein NlpE [Dysgonamonadaceae bacterium]